MDSEPIKTYVLDTNVLLHNPNALFAYGHSHVVIPIVVLEELDRFKTASNELGRNSREVCRMLDRLRGGGRSLREGVATPQGGLIQVVMHHEVQEGLLPGLADNHIIGCALLLKREGREVSFITKDINARIKADALGIASLDYDGQKINIDELYPGWRRMEVAASEYDTLRNDGRLTIGADAFSANECAEVVPASNGQPGILARFRAEAGALVALPRPPPCPYGIGSRNREQEFALDLLLDDDLRLVTLVGSAGTGKTLLALAAGLAKVLREDAYAKMLVSRPIMPLGKDIGYLPGSKDDKMTHWMGPIFDNLQFILQEEESNPDDVIKGLLKDETITLEALTYIRGRSISNHFLIVDEAQNLTPHEIKTIISRAGAHTKIVLTGDPYQIDNPYLDSSTNGLTYLVERMRGQAIAGHITLTTSERSDLAALAADLL